MNLEEEINKCTGNKTPGRKRSMPQTGTNHNLCPREPLSERKKEMDGAAFGRGGGRTVRKESGWLEKWLSVARDAESGRPGPGPTVKTCPRNLNFTLCHF